MRNRGLTTGLGWLAVVLLCWAGLSDAATYQLQVASLPERVFMYFTEGRTLPRVEAYLDDVRGSKYVIFRDRQPQPLEPQGAEPFPVRVTLAKPANPWGAMTWGGEAGQLAVFRVRGRQSDHQKLRRVAVQTDGVLTRYPVRGIPVSGPRRMQVPAMGEGFLAHALESGTFADWTERHAVSHGGLSVIVGRHHDARQSDTVYLVVRMPQTGQAYKVILGWENIEHKGGHAKGRGNLN